MSEHFNIKRLGLILAVQAEIEGMKAKNLEREQLNLTLAYTEEHFIDKANELRNLSYAHDEQL